MPGVFSSAPGGLDFEGMAAFLLWTGVALDLGVLIGLAVRDRWRDAWLLPVVVLSALLSTATVGLCSACNTWNFWLLNEFAHVALWLLLGVELSLRLCPQGTVARRHARVWIALVLLVVGVLAFTAPSGIDALPRLAATIIFLYAGLTLVMAAHELELQSALHEALLYGFPPYLLVYVATWGYTRDDTTWAGILNPLAFNLMMLNLLRVVWRRDPAPRPRLPWLTRLGRRRGWL